MADLGELRRGIDRVDRQLLELFIQRMELTKQVGEYKLAHALPVLDPEREAAVLQEKAALAPAELKQETTELFQAMMDISRRQQRRLGAGKSDAFTRYLAEKEQSRSAVKHPRVLYQGQAGAYAQEAALSYFDPGCENRNVADWEDIFLALQRGEADYGVVPIENSSTGSISQVYDLLAHYGAFIVGEVELKIRHCLMARPEVEPEDIQAVYSHPQGLRQCGPYLKERGWRLESCSNTAQAAKYVSESDEPIAAIGSERAAQLYGLRVLRRDITMAEENYTRFVVVSSQPELSEKCDKVSALITLPHKAGTLHQILRVFAGAGLNLMKLESRPIPGKGWKYLFFVDFSGNLLDPKLDRTIQEVAECAEDLRVLGNYPAGEESEI